MTGPYLCEDGNNKGTTINDLGVGPKEIKKKNSEALLREKIDFHTEGVSREK